MKDLSNYNGIVFSLRNKNSLYTTQFCHNRNDQWLTDYLVKITDNFISDEDFTKLEPLTVSFDIFYSRFVWPQEGIFDMAGAKRVVMEYLGNAGTIRELEKLTPSALFYCWHFWAAVFNISLKTGKFIISLKTPKLLPIYL